MAGQIVQPVLHVAALAHLLAQLQVGAGQLRGALAHPVLEFAVEPAQRLQQAAALELVVHPGAHLAGHDRLGDVVGAARGEAGGHVVAAGGHEDDRNVRGGRIGLEPAAGLEAVDARRHHHVEQDQVRVQAAGQLERALAAGGGQQVGLEGGQRVLEQRDVLRRVVDQEDLRRGVVGGGGHGVFGSCGAVLPAPSCSRASIWRARSSKA